MDKVESSRVWEMLSPQGEQWVRVVVTDVKDDRIVLRYEGTLELLWIDVEELEDGERFRPVID